MDSKKKYLHTKAVVSFFIANFAESEEILIDLDLHHLEK